MRFEALNISSRNDAASVHVCLIVSTFLGSWSVLFEP